jgi:oligopeptide/dipeptide ABC transporter ATP-binding protein
MTDESSARIGQKSGSGVAGGDAATRAVSSRQSALLDVEDIVTTVGGGVGRRAIVDGVSFMIDRGERVGLVGESGSGKTTVASSVLRILPPGLTLSSGRIRLGQTDLLEAAPAELRRLRSARMARVPQDSLGGLNPVLTIGYQMKEVLRAHQKLGRKTLEERVVTALQRVAVPDAASKLRCYPHELSGGMRQRVLIAMALLNEPELLIADEPTTALDVTIQAQVVNLLRECVDDTAMALLLITHDIGVIASLCDRILVMYAGQIVEDGAVADVLARPAHPYTQALIRAAHASVAEQPITAAGEATADIGADGGCRYAARCPLVMPICRERPGLTMRECGWPVRCHAVSARAEEVLL